MGAGSAESAFFIVGKDRLARWTVLLGPVRRNHFLAAEKLKNQDIVFGPVDAAKAFTVAKADARQMKRAVGKVYQQADDVGRITERLLKGTAYPHQGTVQGLAFGINYP